MHTCPLGLAVSLISSAVLRNSINGMSRCCSTVSVWTLVSISVCCYSLPTRGRLSVNYPRLKNLLAMLILGADNSQGGRLLHGCEVERFGRSGELQQWVFCPAINFGGRSVRSNFHLYSTEMLKIKRLKRGYQSARNA
jgi:hypothetical protein